MKTNQALSEQISAVWENTEGNRSRWAYKGVLRWTEGPRAAAHGPLVQTMTAQQHTLGYGLSSLQTGEERGQQDQQALCSVLSGSKRSTVVWHRG